MGNSEPVRQPLCCVRHQPNENKFDFTRQRNKVTCSGKFPREKVGRVRPRSPCQKCCRTKTFFTRFSHDNIFENEVSISDCDVSVMLCNDPHDSRDTNLN